MTLNDKSLVRLLGVHVDLVAVVKLAASVCPLNFQISEGLRTPDRQRELVAAGKSQTQNSRHLTGHAVDVVVINPDGSANWSLDKYRTVAASMKAAADKLGIPVIWGGSWKTLVDGPHFELDRRSYP